MLNSISNKKIIFIESLLILFPISLLVSNIISEFFILILISVYLNSVRINHLKNELKDFLIFILCLFWIYLLVNFFLNKDNNPDLFRSIFFLRFIFLILAIKYFFNIKDLNQDKIFISWLFIIIVICLDLIFQFYFKKNILGFEAILQGDFYRLGGFMDDELKISFLIFNFGALVFSYFVSKKKKNLFLTCLIYFFLVLILISIYLTGERSNFITLLSFVFIVSIFFIFKKEYSIILILITFLGGNYFLGNNSISNRMFSDLKSKIQLLKVDNDQNFFYKDSHYFAHYATAYEIFKKNKLFGVGIKNFRYFCDEDVYKKNVFPSLKSRNCATHPHSFYLEILSEIGMVGFIILMFFFCLSLYRIFLTYLINKNLFLIISGTIILVYFIPMLPRGSFFTNWSAMIFWMTFSIVFRNIKIK